MLVEAMLVLAANPEAVRCRGVSLSGAVADYARRTRAMDHAGIAALFGPGGQSVAGGRTLTGSAAIAAFLDKFAGYRVTAETMTVADTTRLPGGWRTDGRFVQSGTTPDGTAYAAHGRFAIDWRCDARAGWRVRRMETTGD